jgi:hypothetical protein
VDLHKVGLKPHMIAARTTEACAPTSISSDGDDRQEVRQQLGCEAQEDGAE